MAAADMLRAWPFRAQHRLVLRFETRLAAKHRFICLFFNRIAYARFLGPENLHAITCHCVSLSHCSF